MDDPLKDRKPEEQGQPLAPGLPTSSETFMRMMRENCLRPLWLQLMHGIDDELRPLRAGLGHSCRLHKYSCPRLWAVNLAVTRVRIIGINSLVDYLNMLRPATMAGIISMNSTIAPGSLYAAVGFADEAHVFQPLTFDAGLVMSTFLSNVQSKGASSSGAGLMDCRDILKSVTGPKTIVLVADGVDSKSPLGVEGALVVKAYGKTIVSVGVGANDAGHLRDIASGEVGNELYTSMIVSA